MSAESHGTDIKNFVISSNIRVITTTRDYMSAGSHGTDMYIEYWHQQ